MPIRARSAASGAISALVAGLIVAGGVTPATAVPADCKDVGSIRATKLQSCIDDLRSESEAAGRRAAKADEAYLQAKQTTSRARKELEVAGSLADQAAAIAVRSRARAAAVAAHLARGGGSVGQTAEVLMSGDGATAVLYHLSRMSELGADSGQLATQAAGDRRTAELLREQAATAADQVAEAERHARAAFATAKKESDAARVLVLRAESKQGGGSEGKVHYVDLPANASTGAKVVAFARAQIGEPYVFGGAGPRTWDCSGLSMMAFQTVGISIGGHSSNAQYHLAASKGLLVPYSAAQPGDLVFYGSGDMYHVAIYSGGGNMVEAPMPGKSVREVPVRGGGRAAMVARFTG